LVARSAYLNFTIQVAWLFFWVYSILWWLEWLGCLQHPTRGRVVG